MFSVLIPVYNHARYIDQAVVSALRSSLVGEVLLVDDGSTDESAKAIERLSRQYPRVHVLPNPEGKNWGAHNRLNQLVSAASHEWLAVLNSDDEFVAGRFEAIAAVRKNDTDFVFGGLTMMDRSGRITKSKRAFIPPEFELPPELMAAEISADNLPAVLANQNYIFTTSNMVFTKELFSRVGGFRNYCYCHDWDFALRASLLGKVQFVPQPLTKYRLHESNTISDDWRKVHREVRAMFAKVFADFPGLREKEGYSVALAGNRYLQGELEEAMGAGKVDLGSLPGDQVHLYNFLSESGAFNRQHYLNQVEKPEDAIDPLLHFIRNSEGDDKNPNEWFDVTHYRRVHPDLHGSAVDLFMHYLQHGFKEMRKPNATWSHFRLPPAMAAQLPALMKEWIEGLSETGNTEWLSYMLPCTSPQPAGQMSKRIVFFGHEASRTGAPMVLLNLVKLFAESGFECVTFLKKGGALLCDYMKYSYVINLSGCDRMDSVVSYYTSRIVSHPGFLGGIANSVESLPLTKALATRNCPLMFLVHELADGYSAEYLQQVSDAATQLVFSSHFARQAFEQKARVPSNKVRVHPQGLLDPNFGKIDRTSAREQLREELGLPQDSFVVIACGTLDPRKGIDLFVESARKVAATHSRANNIHFVWIGDGENHPFSFYYYCRWDVTRYGLEDQVHFIGERSDLNLYFAGADLFLMASRQDPFPCVVQNAMAAGLPVIAFDNAGGVPEILCHGGGDVVPYGDTSAIAELILQYADDSQRVQQVGERGRQVIRDSYQFQDYFAKLRDTLVAEDSDTKSLLPSQSVAPFSIKSGG